MKWVWSIGNKINDGHKALAVVTLNNPSLDASLLLLHDALSVSTALCSNSWSRPLFNVVQQKQKKKNRASRDWQGSLHWTQRISPKTTFSVLHICVTHDGKQVDLQSAQRDVLFNLVDGEVQPTIVFCHPVAWKAAERPTLQLPAAFKVFFPPSSEIDAWKCTFVRGILEARKQELGLRKSLLSLSDGGQWMELSEALEWWNKTSSLVLTFVHIFRPLALLSHVPTWYFLYTCATTGNICSRIIRQRCHTDEPLLVWTAD